MPVEEQEAQVTESPDYFGPKVSEEGEAITSLPDYLQAELRNIAHKCAERERYPRLCEIRAASKQRFFYNNIQHLAWSSDDKGLFQVGQNGGGFGSSDTKQDTFRQAFNIYLGYAKTFMSVFCQNQVGTRFEAEDPKNSRDIEAAAEAQKMKRIIEKFSNAKMMQIDCARLFWTDGRVLAHTRYVTDGQKFGYTTNDSGEKVPKAREITTIYGALESKVPLTTKDMSEWMYAMTSVEFDIALVKELLPSVKSKLGNSVQACLEADYARTARVSVAEGTPILSQGGDGLAHLVTVDNVWLRPCAFELASEQYSDELKEYFPDGAHVTFAGDKYAKSENENLDDHLAECHALPGDGQNRQSLGASEVPIQETFNDLMNLHVEGFEFCVPATWIAEDAVDIDAVNEQEAQYGAHYPAEKKAGEALGDSFYTETPVQIPDSMSKFTEMLQGPLSQFITSQPPALFGGEMDSQKTAHGYAQARDQAMGVMGLIWMPFTYFVSKIMLQAVMEAAKNRPKDKPIAEMVPTQGGAQDRELIEVDIEALKGNLACYPETDENFPESWTQKSNKYMNLVEASAANPAIAAILAHPDNQALGKDLIGLEDLVIPDADSRDKQLKEIAELLKILPIPDQEKMQEVATIAKLGEATGNPVPPPDPEKLLQSSVPIDPIFDNHMVEFEECKRWINSKEGQKAKEDNQDGFENVRLHAIAHQQQMQAQMMPPMMGATPGGAPGMPPSAAPPPGPGPQPLNA